MQYDIYHMQLMEGDLARDDAASTCARIAHMQLADNPGRNEPGTGEINYPFLFAHLDRIGYTRLDRLRVQAGDDAPKPASAGSTRSRQTLTATRHQRDTT